MVDFLNKEEANQFYAEKSPLREHILKLPIMNMVKAFPGKRYVLFEKKGGDVAVHGCFRANVISMDRDGLFVLLKDTHTEQHTRIGYVPTPITSGDGRAVFLAIPSHCKMERTLRKRRDRVMESVAVGILVRQQENPDEVPFPENVLMFMGYEEFKKVTGRTITELEF